MIHIGHDLIDAAKHSFAYFPGETPPGRLSVPGVERSENIDPARPPYDRDIKLGGLTLRLVKRFRSEAAPTHLHSHAGDSGPVWNEGEGAMVVVPSWSAPALATVQAQLAAQVDAAAEQVRLRYITAGDGMALTYDAKRREAEAAVNDAEPQHADYPILAASLGIEGATIAEIAALVIARRDQWTAIAVAIETARLGGKRAINQAADIAGAIAAAEAVEWPNGA